MIGARVRVRVIRVRVKVRVGKGDLGCGGVAAEGGEREELDAPQHGG